MLLDSLRDIRLSDLRDAAFIAIAVGLVILFFAAIGG